jgi:microsomal epoxide hydrolase
MIQYLRDNYTPETLPVHVIVPSLVGYGYSSPPPKDRDFITVDNGELFNRLMKGLGFDSYVVQGGDVGGLVAPMMGESFPEVKAVHINYLMIPPANYYDESDLDEVDQRCLVRMKHMEAYEVAYAHEHGQKPSTIAMVIQSSPVALLAW